MNRDDMDFGGLSRDRARKRAAAAAEAGAIAAPDGYANTGREGASAPDASTDFNARNAGRTILTNLRCPVCGASVVMFKDEIQFNIRTGKHFLITDCCKAAIPYDNERVVPPLTPRRAADICTEAAHLVGVDRAATHGDIALSWQNIAKLWDAYINAKVTTHNGLVYLDAHDACNMMELVKIARRLTGSHNIDDYIDGAGYAACAGEIAEKFNAK